MRLRIGCRDLPAATAKVKDEDDAEEDGGEAGGLGVGHAEEGARIDADEFDEEARAAGEN